MVRYKSTLKLHSNINFCCNANFRLFLITRNSYGYLSSAEGSLLHIHRYLEVVQWYISVMSCVYGFLDCWLHYIQALNFSLMIILLHVFRSLIDFV